MQLAITREVSRSINKCELTYLSREPIDLVRARQQHAQYERTLRDLGLAVLSLPEIPDLPDAVFVEDTALVLDECVILLRPGAASRLPEVNSIGKVLANFRPLNRLRAPAHADGGDILRIGQRIFIGVGQRTNVEAIGQIRSIVTPFGYSVQAAPTAGCLHLKSAATEVGPDTVLVNPKWIESSALEHVKCLEVDPSEGYAANALRLGDTVLFPEAFPRTRRKLEQANIQIRTLPCDELAKAEGALTCCSLVLNI
jgi:dimethylargininase